MNGSYFTFLPYGNHPTASRDATASWHKRAWRGRGSWWKRELIILPKKPAMGRCWTLDQNPPSSQCPGRAHLCCSIPPSWLRVSHCHQLFEEGRKGQGIQAQIPLHSIPGSPDLPQPPTAMCSAETPIPISSYVVPCKEPFWVPWAGTVSATAWEVSVGVCWEAVNDQKLGFSCWDGQNGLEISPSPMCRAVFSVSLLSCCQGRIRPFYILLL